MVTNEDGQGLHDRATRGLPLSDEERDRLHEWYSRMDADEAERLRASRSPLPIELLEREITTAAARIEETNALLRTQLEESKRLHQELAALADRAKDRGRRQAV